MAVVNVLIAVWGLYLGLVCSREIFRCFEDEDCPPGALCYKDECPRCLCRNGTVLDKLYDGGILTEICNTRYVVYPRVGDACGPDDRCPYNSLCHQGACICQEGLVPDVRDGSHCRLSGYREPCDVSRPCDDILGFVCHLPEVDEATEGGNTSAAVEGVCGCKSSHHRPTPWSRFVLGRWDYAAVEGSPQECVTRAVGEPCASDEECAAVQGSGAICGHCGYCECRRKSHVPDILGTKCGPGHLLGQKCSLQSRYVCDGTLGLECGDVCDLYAGSYAFKRKHCTCSQMHNPEGSNCNPKTVGSECTTDLDCFPVIEGFGYCHQGTCHANDTISPPSYLPYTVDRKCVLRKLTPAGGEKPRQPEISQPSEGSTTISHTLNREVSDGSKRKATEIEPGHKQSNAPPSENSQSHLRPEVVKDGASMIKNCIVLPTFTLLLLYIGGS